MLQKDQTTGEKKYIDRSRFTLCVVTGKRALALRYADLFFDNNNGYFVKLHKAMKTGDRVSVGSALHAIKASAGTVGAAALLEMTREFLKLSAERRVEELNRAFDGYFDCFKASYLALVQEAERFAD